MKNEKLKNIKTTMNIYYCGVALIALMSFTDVSQAMDTENFTPARTPRSIRNHELRLEATGDGTTCPPWAQHRINDDEKLHSGSNVNLNNENSLIEQALNQDADAQRCLGQFYTDTNDTQKALIYYRHAAAQGDILSNFAIGKLWIHSDNEEEKQTAITCFTTAAEEGHAESQFSLGMICLDEKKYKEAAGLFKKAASQNYPDAQEQIKGISLKLYEEVDALLKDPQKKPEAIRYLKLAAADGIIEAHNKLGELYLSDGKIAKAVKRFEKAMVQKDAKNQCKLGTLYLEKLEVQDFSRAKKLFELAHAQGHPEATHRLAWMYYKGEGVQENEYEAIELWIEASLKGAKLARDKLGEIVDGKNLKVFLMVHPNAKPLFQ